MGGPKQEAKPEHPHHPQYLALTIDPLFGDDERAGGLELVRGFDVAWGDLPEGPVICFIAADEVTRDFGGEMLLFSHGGRPGGLWIACDAILWMRPATRKVDLRMGHAPFKPSSDSSPDSPHAEED